MAQNINKPFRPWIKNLWAGFAGLVVFILILTIEQSNKLNWSNTSLVIVLGLLSGFTAWQFKLAAVRSFGQRLERRSVKKLMSILGDANVRASIPLPGQGDIDCAALINQTKFNIEIKAFRQIKRINRQHIAQVRAAANYLKTTPVIWLPNADHTHFGERDSVRLCACDAKRLVRELS